jgi:hypothetical protein
MVRTGLGKKCDLIRKIIKAQRSGAMAQAVENLPEFSSTKKKKKLFEPSCLSVSQTEVLGNRIMEFESYCHIGFPGELSHHLVP